MIESSPPKRKRPRKKASPEVTIDVNQFDIRCECGEKISGARIDDIRLTPCPSCDRLHYILPKNPYPEPRKVKVKKKRKPGQAGKAIAASLTSLFKSAGKVVSRKTSAAAGSAKNSLLSTAAWIRSQITPLRSLSVSILLVLVLTVWYGIRSQNYARAQVQFSDSWTSAQKLLQSRELDASDEQLQLAVKALNTLAPGDSLEKQVRQLGRETNALTHLCSYELFEIASDAQNYVENGNSRLWPTHFKTLYQGSWMVFDLRVRRHTNWQTSQPDKTEEPAYEFARDIYLNDQPIVIDGNLPCLQTLPVESSYERVIFAAQLKDWKPDEQTDGWRIILDPDSAFLWCHPETLQMVTDPRQPWETEDEIQTLFRRQSEAADVEPATQLLTAQSNP